MTRRSGPDVKPEIGMVVELACYSNGVTASPGDRNRRTIGSVARDDDWPVSERLWNLGCYDILSDAPAAELKPTEPSAHDVHFQAVMRIFREYLRDLDEAIRVIDIDHETDATLILRERYVKAARAIDRTLVERVDDGLAKYAYQEATP